MCIRAKCRSKGDGRWKNNGQKFKRDQKSKSERKASVALSEKSSSMCAIVAAHDGTYTRDDTVTTVMHGTDMHGHAMVSHNTGVKFILDSGATQHMMTTLMSYLKLVK